MQPGERLYNLAQLRQKQKETFVKKLKEEKQQVELEQCKQVPEISRNTNIILVRRLSMRLEPYGLQKGVHEGQKGAAELRADVSPRTGQRVHLPAKDQRDVRGK